MESEKVKEIKKALELNEYYAIEYFPKSGEPKIFTFTDILTLINELESENAYQKEHIEMWFRKNEEKKKLIDELENENVKQLKQFAERLKEKYGKSCSEYYPLLLELTSEQLDETLKEFINE